MDNPEPESPAYIGKGGKYYSFSGSRVMIDQATEDFLMDDLPTVTVIKKFVNKQRKK